MFGPFPSPFSYYFAEEMHPRPLLELRLISVSASIRNKPDWHLKRRDPEIVARWQREAVAQHITPIQFKYVMDELDYYEKLRSDIMEVASVDGVWKASSLFPERLCTEFSRLVAKLADIPDHQKDWHPGSDGRVLDLVHPGLYLFVSGKTRTIQPNQPDDAPSVPTSLPRREGRHEFASNEYQWIPTAIAVDTNGKVTFLSYINNLHPGKNIPLYGVLSDMLAHTLPMFERVLTFLSSPLGPKINLRGFNWYEDSNYPKQLEGETDNDYWERVEVWENTRPIKPIPLKDYVEPPKVDPVVLRDCKLQVIVKIQEIHLTPEKPVYDGGVWHIEGMENERIVSSAIYYYDSSNITECTLSFRQAVGDPYYEQNDNRGVMEVFGLEDGQPLVQNLGSVVTKPGLVLAWPNIYQHRVSSFELIDKTKPGKRGILVFFLIDPSTPMEYDTLRVPPQQRDWWHEKVNQDPTLRTYLPQELRDLVVDWVDDPMPLEVAKEHRQKSMDERKYLRDSYTEETFEREFSLCEH